MLLVVNRRKVLPILGIVTLATAMIGVQLLKKKKKGRSLAPPARAVPNLSWLLLLYSVAWLTLCLRDDTEW